MDRNIWTGQHYDWLRFACKIGFSFQNTYTSNRIIPDICASKLSRRKNFIKTFISCSLYEVYSRQCIRPWYVFSCWKRQYLLIRLAIETKFAYMTVFYAIQAAHCITAHILWVAKTASNTVEIWDENMVSLHIH